MKKTLITVIALIFCFIIADRSLEKLLWWNHEHSKNVLDKQVSYIVNEIDADFVVMGASRVNHHFVPRILGDSLKMSVYNAGIDGSGDIFYQYVMLNLILQHHIPKIICLEVGGYLIDGKTKNLPQLAPYIGRSNKADSVFISLGTYNGYQLSHVYRYQSVFLRNLFGLFGFEAGTPFDRGYIPLPAFDKELPPIQKLVKFKYDPLAINYLHKYIVTCKKHNIQLVLCASPWRSIPTQGQYNYFEQLAKKENIVFLNYHTLFQNDKNFWRDNFHMCAKASEVFTSYFVHDTKKRLSNVYE